MNGGVAQAGGSLISKPQPPSKPAPKQVTLQDARAAASAVLFPEQSAGECSFKQKVSSDDHRNYDTA